MTRILHFSDVHVEGPFGSVPWWHFLNKRLIGFSNLRLLRGRRHREAVPKLEALERLMREVDVDLVVCTGDYTALGLEPEIARARRVIEPFTHRRLGFVTVPGNHDLYLRDAVQDGRFERHFGDLMGTDLPDLRTEGRWPLVRLPEEGLAIVAVNSARPNPQPWRSSGRIPDAQLEGLARVLDDPRLAGRFIVVATHYAPRGPRGGPDTPRHGLDNAEALLEVCRRIERGILLHGHVHHCYHVRLPDGGPVLFGAGSATHRGREGLWLFDVGPDRGTARRGRWVGDHYELDAAEPVAI